jgi:DNA-binding transcriptional regulator YbjK
MSRRDEVLEAAIQVTAERGVRGLTHRAVDEVGELPAGTTSNYFRSRQSLTTGTFERLGEIMAGIIANVGDVKISNEADLIATLGTSLGMSLGPGRVIATALTAMFTEAGIDESLHPTVVRTNQLWWAAIEGMLRDAGITEDVELRARCLLSYGNGLVVDQLALRDPDFDPVAAMRVGILGFSAG